MATHLYRPPQPSMVPQVARSTIMPSATRIMLLQLRPYKGSQRQLLCWKWSYCSTRGRTKGLADFECEVNWVPSRLSTFVLGKKHISILKVFREANTALSPTAALPTSMRTPSTTLASSTMQRAILPSPSPARSSPRASSTAPVPPSAKNWSTILGFYPLRERLRTRLSGQVSRG